MQNTVPIEQMKFWGFLYSQDYKLKMNVNIYMYAYTRMYPSL